MATEGEPVPVKQHDFMDKELGKGFPMEVRPDAEQRLGERCVDHETASLAVELAVVVPDGAIRLSAGNGVINYCRLWWQQQLSQSLVEMGTQQLLN